MCYTVNPWPVCICPTWICLYTQTKWEQLFAPSAPSHDSETLQYSDLNVKLMSSPLTASLVPQPMEL
jgi:hypothetical protein